MRALNGVRLRPTGPDLKFSRRNCVHDFTVLKRTGRKPFSIALKINLGTSRTHRKLSKHLRDAKMMTPVEKPKLLEELMTTKSAT